MLSVSVVRNKAQHIANKIEKRCHCECKIWVLLESAIADTEFAHLIDDRYVYAFELEVVAAKVTPYMKNQLNYLNGWLSKYNRKSGTKFVCIDIVAVRD